MSIGGCDHLMYSYVSEGGGIAWVSHDSLRQTGNGWTYLPDGASEEVRS